MTRETSTTVVIILLCPSVICCRPWKLVPCRERQLVLSMLRRCRRGAGQRGRERGRERNLGCMTSHRVSPYVSSTMQGINSSPTSTDSSETPGFVRDCGKPLYLRRATRLGRGLAVFHAAARLARLPGCAEPLPLSSAGDSQPLAISVVTSASTKQNKGADRFPSALKIAEANSRRRGQQRQGARGCVRRARVRRLPEGRHPFAIALA